jgi:hypothetical protein
MSVWRYADADGNVGRVQGSGSSTLYRNGSEVATSGSFGGVAASGLPADKASYRPVRGTRPSSRTPAGPSVSLKATLVDAAGNTTEQPVIAAYPIR